MLNPFRTGLSMKREVGATDGDAAGVPAELNEDQLDVAGGGAQESSKSPRDASSGLATGRRSHSPEML